VTIYITWDDVGRTEIPGRVTVGGRSFQVEQVHIDVWKDHPTGAWSLTEIRTDEVTQWVLSSFYQSRDNV
jgi:hypothetical protein